MNILIVKEKRYISAGNNALLPERRSNGEDQKKKLLQERNKKLKNEKQLKLKNQAKVMMGIGLTFLIGFTVVYRYSAIYTMESKLSASTLQTNNLVKQNESLKVQLMQYSQVQNIKDEADKLNMVQPDNSKAVAVDYDKPVIKYSSNENSQKSPSIFQIIKDKIF